jgi:hypothetical protein
MFEIINLTKLKKSVDTELETTKKEIESETEKIISLSRKLLTSTTNEEQEELTKLYFSLDFHKAEIDILERTKHDFQKLISQYNTEMIVNDLWNRSTEEESKAFLEAIHSSEMSLDPV